MNKSSVSRFVAVALLVFSLACSTRQPTDENTLRASFFQNADRVWSAIQMSLIDLDYEMGDSNRMDGTMSASSSVGETTIELDIRQIQYTEDQVNVFVRPVDGGGTTAAEAGALRAAGDAFMKLLSSKLGG